jgi:hypothetical protein
MAHVEMAKALVIQEKLALGSGQIEIGRRQNVIGMVKGGNGGRNPKGLD